jgi:hypothetical protein
MPDPTPDDEAPDGLAADLEYVVGGTSATEYLLWLVVLAALTLDVVLTAWGLQYGLAEWNPFMRHLIEGLGFPVLGLAKALVLGVAGLLRAARPDLGVLIPLAVGVPWMAVVVVNLVMLYAT